MLLQRHTNLGPALKISAFRKVAIGTWRTVGDPSVYGVLEIDVGNALNYIERLSKKSGQRITITHFIGLALGKTYQKYPQLNCILSLGRLYPRKDVDVFFQVASDAKGEDLSGTIIRKIDFKSLVEIAQEMDAKVKKIRDGTDTTYKKSKGMMAKMPGILVGPILTLLSFINFTLNLWSPLLGSPRDSFGSMMITNIGPLDLEMAFAPIVPYSRVPALYAVGAIREKPVVENGEIKIAKMMTVCGTFDHRLIDGMYASFMAREVRAIFKDPESAFGAV